MSQVQQVLELDEVVWGAARAAAVRRGVEPALVVEEAIRRFVAADDLEALFVELRTGSVEVVDDDEAMEIACEELAALRAERSA